MGLQVSVPVLFCIKKNTCYRYRKEVFNLFCMFLKDWIKQLGPCNIHRSIEPTYEITKDIDNIQQDNAIVVILNLNHEVIYIFLF